MRLGAAGGHQQPDGEDKTENDLVAIGEGWHQALRGR
jgi:hypothetical protein